MRLPVGDVLGLLLDFLLVVERECDRRYAYIPIIQIDRSGGDAVHGELRLRSPVIRTYFRRLRGTRGQKQERANRHANGDPPGNWNVTPGR